MVDRNNLVPVIDGLLEIMQQSLTLAADHNKPEQERVDESLILVMSIATITLRYIVQTDNRVRPIDAAKIIAGVDRAVSALRGR